jgi:hypothetical protein
VKFKRRQPVADDAADGRSFHTSSRSRNDDVDERRLVIA